MWRLELSLGRGGGLRGIRNGVEAGAATDGDGRAATATGLGRRTRVVRSQSPIDLAWAFVQQLLLLPQAGRQEGVSGRQWQMGGCLWGVAAAIAPKLDGAAKHAAEAAAKAGTIVALSAAAAAAWPLVLVLNAHLAAEAAASAAAGSIGSSTAGGPEGVDAGRRCGVLVGQQQRRLGVGREQLRAARDQG